MDVKERFDNIDILYRHKKFNKISNKWAKKVDIVRTFIENDNKNGVKGELTYHKTYFSGHIDIANLKLTKEEKRMRKNLTAIEELKEKNNDVLQYVRTPSYSSDTMKDTQILILQTVMSV